jgi:hypothetical protein
MKLRNATFVFFVVALVACSGGRLMPAFDSPTSSVSNKISPALAELSRLYPQFGEQLKSLASTSATCTAPYAKLPGTYPEMLVFDGSVKGTTFTSVPDPGLTQWLLAKWVKGTPAPTPSPGSTPTPKTTPTPVATAPPGQPLYFYLGSYTLKKYGQGCVFMLTSVNGKKIKKEKNDAFAIGTPLFKGNFALDQKVAIQSGPLTMTIRNLSATGGKGNVTLLNASGHGKNVDTGTVTLTGRIELKP